jgi:hypothetical protein
MCALLPHAQVQNSISMELLPQAAAAAAAAEQLLGASPGAAAAGMLSPRGGVQSPFAAVDAEVFVCSPRHLSALNSPVRPGMQQQQQQQHRRGGSQSRQQQQAAAALERQLSRVVSAKPSFAQPMSELKLVGRWVVRSMSGCALWVPCFCCSCCFHSCGVSLSKGSLDDVVAGCV